VLLYFITSNGRLVPVASLIGRPVSLYSQIGELLNGPGVGAPADVQTAIPVGTEVLSAKVTSGIATLNLTPAIENASGEQLIQALAQLVFTATTATTCPSPPAKEKKIKARELPPTTTTTLPQGALAALPCADSVLVDVDGQPELVPTATGAQTSKPVTRNDYSALY
jgi:spore germination protein GerM